MSMKHLELYESFRKPPGEALRTIGAGRLKGKTDINPMWRIKALTEQFGPCGIGWKYAIKEQRVIPGANEEQAAFVDIDLYYKKDGEWSDPIPGAGGSMFVSKEKSGLYTDDECFKKALTDAISVAAKALGIGADVYWDKDPDKYIQIVSCPQCGKTIKPIKDKSGRVMTAEDILTGFHMCVECVKKKQAEQADGG